MYIECTIGNGWEEINLYGVICIINEEKLEIYIVVPYIMC